MCECVWYVCERVFMYACGVCACVCVIACYVGFMCVLSVLCVFYVCCVASRQNRTHIT